MFLQGYIKSYRHKARVNVIAQPFKVACVFNILLLISSCNMDEGKPINATDEPQQIPPSVIPADKISNPEFYKDGLALNYEAALNKGFSTASIDSEYNVSRVNYSLSDNHTISKSPCIYKWEAEARDFPIYDCLGDPSTNSISKEDKNRTILAISKNGELIEVVYNRREQLIPRVFDAFQFIRMNWYLDDELVHSEELPRHYSGNELSLYNQSIRDWARRYLITIQHERPTIFSQTVTDNIDPKLVFSNAATEFVIYPTRTETVPYFSEDFIIHSANGERVDSEDKQINNLREFIDGGYYLEVDFSEHDLDYGLPHYKIKLNASRGATEGNATIGQNDSIEGTFTWKLTTLHGRPALVFEQDYQHLLDDWLYTYELPLAIIETKDKGLVQKYADISYSNYDRYRGALNSAAMEELINALHPSILQYIQTENSQ